LQQTNNIEFCDTNNEQVLAYYKFDDDKENETLMVASLDAYNTAQAMVRIPNALLRNLPLRITDLITGNSYIWDKEWNFVELSPELPFHLFKIRR
jgi:starch synthase (maltosyl-transferring)